MTKAFDLGYSRIVQVPRSAPNPPKNFVISTTNWASLAGDIAQLRADVDDLIADFERDCGCENQITLRAEQVSGALQRLEWAIQRELKSER
jgi:hypothetical protein